MRAKSRLVSAFAISVVAAAGCAAPGAGWSGNPSSDAGGGEGGGQDSGGRDSGGPRPGDGDLPDDGGSDPDSDAGKNPNECVGESRAAEHVPLALYFMIDMRSTMGDFWDNARIGIKNFLENKEGFDLSGLRIGINVFPSRNEACVPASYTGNLAIPFEALPAGADILRSALDSVEPQGGATASLRPALEGAIRGAWYEHDPATERAAVVLVTDGTLMPKTCVASPPDDIARTAGVARAGFEDDGVRTFVIGMSDAETSDKDNALAIAEAGGSSRVIFVQKNASVFQKALQDIRTSAIACEYKLPKIPAGQALDYNKVAVDLQLDGEAELRELPRMKGDACVDGTEGWVYDDAVNPTKILLCPTICNQLATDAKAKIDIRLGCSPIIR